MTNQEIFWRVKDHLLAQGKPAKAFPDDPDDPRCAYRTSDGLKCAVGCLIPDELYVPQMEGKFVAGLLFEFPKALGFTATKEQVELMRALQRIHDVRKPDTWEASLRELASAEGLAYERPAEG